MSETGLTPRVSSLCRREMLAQPVARASGV